MAKFYLNVVCCLLRLQAMFFLISPSKFLKREPLEYTKSGQRNYTSSCASGRTQVGQNLRGLQYFLHLYKLFGSRRK